MGIFSDLRVIASLSRSLKTIADELTTVRIQLNFKSLAQLRADEKLASKELAEREARDALGRPSPDDFDRNEVQLALDQLQERLRRGEEVSDEEMIAASNAIAQLEGTSDTDHVAY